MLVFLPTADTHLALLIGQFAHTLQIEPKEQECFYEQLEKGKSFSMNFEVLRGGLLDIKLTITDPVEQVLFDKLAFFNRQVSCRQRRISSWVCLIVCRILR